jgi:uncharacterized protein YbdZ (MbtH family)
MEYHSPVYELLSTLEQLGMRLPKGWDLLPETSILQACRAFLEANRVHTD